MSVEVMLFQSEIFQCSVHVGYHSNSGDKCMNVSFSPSSFRVCDWSISAFLISDGRGSDSWLKSLLLAYALNSCGGNHFNF